MKRFSRKASRARQLAIFGFFALTIPLTVSSSKPSADQVKQAGWRVEIGEGTQTRSTLTINNRCSEPHLFRITSSAKYLLFEESTESVLIKASSSRQLGARFDATGLKPKVYKTNVVVKCLDCKKKGSKCTQDRDEVSVELTVTKPSIYKTILLTRGKLDQSKGTMGISRIMPSTDASRLAEGSVQAKARIYGGYLNIEFTAPLPNKSQMLVVDSNLPLHGMENQSCMIPKGSYNVDYSTAQNGLAKLPVVVNPSTLQAQLHRRRPSRRWRDIG